MSAIQDSKWFWPAILVLASIFALIEGTAPIRHRGWVETTATVTRVEKKASPRLRAAFSYWVNYTFEVDGEQRGGTADVQLDPDIGRASLPQVGQAYPLQYRASAPEWQHFGPRQRMDWWRYVLLVGGTTMLIGTTGFVVRRRRLDDRAPERS